MKAAVGVVEWAQRLRGAAGPVLAGTPVVDARSTAAQREEFIRCFADERGHRRAVDRPLLVVLLGGSMGEGDRGEGSEARPNTPTTPDLELWSLIAARQPWRAPGWLRATGPLASGGMVAAIEVWTETELSCMHALWSIARRERDAGLRDRCLDAARWMIAQMQPDNGTNHPWAIHLFAWMWATIGDVDARLYAETMLHNSMVSLGRPDRFSACVLWHAATELEAAAEAP